MELKISEVLKKLKLLEYADFNDDEKQLLLKLCNVNQNIAISRSKVIVTESVLEELISLAEITELLKSGSKPRLTELDQTVLWRLNEHIFIINKDFYGSENPVELCDVRNVGYLKEEYNNLNIFKSGR